MSMRMSRNNFLLGFQVGYRLGRPPKNRKPKVPSGEYMITEEIEDRMITESGDRMVTE